MTFPYKQLNLHRAGKQFRINLSRFFFVKRLGWFVHTRGDTVLSEGVVAQDGVIGPFPNEITARDFVNQRLLKSSEFLSEI
jgi:hypothetical protein